MRAVMLVADAAVVHPDNTFSILRGGITETNVPPNRPAMFRGAILVRIEYSAGDKGKHDLRLVCVDEDGKSVAPDITGQLDAKQAGAAHVALNVQITFPKKGRYTFILSLGKQEKDRWTINVKEAPKPKK